MRKLSGLVILIAAVLPASIALVVSAENPRTPLAQLTSQATSTLALAQIETLSVAVTRTDYTAKQNTTRQPDLQSRVEERLKLAGLRINSPDTAASPLQMPQFHIYVDTLTAPDSNSVVLHVSSGVSSAVTLAARRNISLRARIRRIPPIMARVSGINLETAVNKYALAQTDSLITAWRAARSIAETVELPPEPNEPESTSTNPPAKTAPPDTAPTPRTAQPMFVASKNSSVYHLYICRSAKRIAADNRVTYKTKAEAEADGKRPCKICQP